MQTNSICMSMKCALRECFFLRHGNRRGNNAKSLEKKSKINEVKLKLQILFLKLYSADYLSSLQNAAEHTLLTNDYWINKLQLHAANWLLTVSSLYETHEVIFSRVRAGQVPQNMQLFDLAISLCLSLYILFMNIQINVCDFVQRNVGKLLSALCF